MEKEFIHHSAHRRDKKKSSESDFFDGSLQGSQKVSELQCIINNSPQVQYGQSIQDFIDNSSHVRNEKRRISNLFGKHHSKTIQRKPDPEKEGEPPHKLVEVDENNKRHQLSDAIAGNLKSVAEAVKTYTGINIGTGFGDTNRYLDMKTIKVGADNFSWHKTGRAFDINQNLKWVIVKDPQSENMFFRIYLLKTSEAETPYDTTFVKDSVTFDNNPYSGNVYKKTFIDVTAILEENGFERIKAHKGWENSYNKKEWWHYEKRDGLNMYQALKELYPEAEIIDGYKGLVNANKDSSCARLKREAFEESIILKMIGNPVKAGDLSLYCSVGNGRNVPNLEVDVIAVQDVLNRLGCSASGCTGSDLEVMINSVYRDLFGKKMDKPFITAGGLFHQKLGNLWVNSKSLGSLTLLESVGIGKANLPSDVLDVKKALNSYISKGVITGERLTEDSSVDESFITLIKEFQSKVLTSPIPSGIILKGSLSHQKLGEI